MNIRDDDGATTYVPYVGEQGEVGYICHHDDGRITHLYLNPSGGSDDGVATVFLYQDEAAGAFEGALHHYAIWEEV